AGHFAHQCRYGESVTSVEPVLIRDRVKKLRILSCDAGGKETVREARSLVVGAGGTPHIPDVFWPVKDSKRIFHHARYMEAMADQAWSAGKPLRVAIVGGGQCSAEVFIDLNDQYPTAKVDVIVRSVSLKPADSSPFVNVIFAPYATDLMFSQAQPAR